MNNPHRGVGCPYGHLKGDGNGAIGGDGSFHRADKHAFGTVKAHPIYGNQITRRGLFYIRIVYVEDILTQKVVVEIFGSVGHPVGAIVGDDGGSGSDAGTRCGCSKVGHFGEAVISHGYHQIGGSAYPRIIGIIPEQFGLHFCSTVA